MRVRKKPVIVEATPIEFILKVGRVHPELLPDWVQKAIAERVLTVYEDVVIVRTIEGNMRGDSGGFLMRGTRAELYPIDGAIFAETYEVVE